ncbi:unnamed protein product [Urochloa humidicola]
MSNFPVDPQPFVPTGFTLAPRELVREPTRMRSFLAFSLDKLNEDLAIAVTEPKIAKEDFWPFARELRRFLLDNHVRDPEIQQCPMGEAFVRFDSPMQRESFIIGGPRQLDDYQISFVRHDEGPNMTDLELDRTAWLMLLYFPPDAKNMLSLVDKSLSGFAQLLHIHISTTVSRLIVKVLINKDADVPDSITVSVGTQPKVRSWTVPIYLLSATDIVLGGDEAPLPADGPTHPLPHPAPGWMGAPAPRNPASMEEAASDNGGVGGNGGGLADMEEDPQNPAAEDGEADQAGKDAINSPFSGASADFAASGGIKTPSPKGPSTIANQVITHLITSSPPMPICTCPFFSLSIFVIDLSASVPSYISDESILFYLAKVVMGPEEVGPGAKRLREDKAAESGDDDLRIISKEEATPSTKKPKKRRARKPRAPMSKEFVRHSERLNADLAGFRDKESKMAHEAENQMVVVDQMQTEEVGQKGPEVEIILKPRALAMVPASDEMPCFLAGPSSRHGTPAPFLSVENVQAPWGQVFCRCSLEL